MEVTLRNMCGHIYAYTQQQHKEKPAMNLKERNEIYGWGSGRKGKGGNDVIILPKSIELS